MQEAYQRLLETARLRFFSDALILKTLCAPDSLQDLEDIRQSLGIQRRRGKDYYRLVNGYKLVVATPIYSLIDDIINLSPLVGLEIDNRLAEWWGWRRDSEGIPTRSAFTFPDSNLADLVVSIQDLAMQFPKSDKWQSFQEAIGKAYTLGENLYESALSSSVSWTQGQLEDLDTVEALRRGAIERVDDYLETGIMSSAYKFAWGHNNHPETIAPEIMDEFWQNTESHLDSPPLPIPERRRTLNWDKGIWAAVSIALTRLGFEGREAIDVPSLFNTYIESPAQVEDRLRNKMNRNWPSQLYGLNQPSSIPLDQLITAKCSVPNIHPEERLQALVGNEEGRILGSYPFDAFHFPTFLEAACKLVPYDNRIEVIRVKHPVLEPSELTWYSIAIRIARFGLFSNSSKWWVFYKAHGFGQMADSEVYHAERLVNESLVKLADRINLIEFEEIDERFFLSLFEPRAWRAMLENVKGIQHENSDLRGVLPELLATELLARRNYHLIRTSFKPQAPGGLELDSLGVRPVSDGGECLVMEIKGQSSTDKVLEQEFERFACKVRILKNHLPELAREIGYAGEIHKISGTFVSMGRPGREYKDPDVTFWDYDDFITELRGAGIPRRLYDRVRPTPVYRLIDFATDAWFQVNDNEGPPDVNGPRGGIT